MQTIPTIKGHPIQLYVMKGEGDYAGFCSHFALSVTGPTVREVQVRMTLLIVASLRWLGDPKWGPSVIRTPSRWLKSLLKPGHGVYTFTMGMFNRPELPVPFQNNKPIERASCWSPAEKMMVAASGWRRVRDRGETTVARQA